MEALQTRLERSLWRDSDNASGLAVDSLPVYNTLDASLSHRNGNYRRLQEGRSETALNVGTEGSLVTGKTFLWGDFSYTNATVRKARYNTVLFDPFDERFLFGVADPVESDWKRQTYDMAFKAARALREDLFAGIGVRYTDRIGAKQNDPRSETFKYSVEVCPGLSYKFGSHTFGISGYYSNVFERSVPTLSNSSEPQDVFILKGLGYYTEDIVGSNGLSTLYYRSNGYGAGAQYFSGRTFAELAMRHFSSSATESATQPFKLGSTGRTEIRVSLARLTAKGKIYLDYSISNTSATEYSSIFNKTNNLWEVRSSFKGSSYTSQAAGAGYVAAVSRGGRPVWKYGLSALWDFENDHRTSLPEATLDYSAVTASAFAIKSLYKGRGVFDLRADIQGRLHLGGEFTYSGHHSADLPASEWYPFDAAILSSDHLQGGLSAVWTLPVGKGMSLGLRLGGLYTAASSSMGMARFLAGASLLF